MMTFYLGKEYGLYEEKFKAIIEHYKPEVKTGSNSEIFRHVVDVLYKEITRLNNNKIDGKIGVKNG